VVSYRAIKRCKIVIVLLAAADGGVVAMVLGNVFYVAVGGVCLLLLVGAVAVGYCRCRWSSHKRPTPPVARWTTHIRKRFNPLEIRGNYSATSNNMRMVHWPSFLHWQTFMNKVNKLNYVNLKASQCCVTWLYFLINAQIYCGRITRFHAC